MAALKLIWRGSNAEPQSKTFTDQANAEARFAEVREEVDVPENWWCDVILTRGDETISAWGRRDPQPKAEAEED